MILDNIQNEHFRVSHYFHFCPFEIGSDFLLLRFFLMSFKDFLNSFIIKVKAPTINWTFGSSIGSVKCPITDDKLCHQIIRVFHLRQDRHHLKVQTSEGANNKFIHIRLDK